MKNKGRVLIGLLYLISALIHLVLGISRPDIFNNFGETALLPLYSSLFDSITWYNGVLFALSLAVIQAVLGWLILNRGEYARLGMIGSLAFQLLVAPLGWWGIINVLLALVHVPLLEQDFRFAAWELEKNYQA